MKLSLDIQKRNRLIILNVTLSIVLFLLVIIINTINNVKYTSLLDIISSFSILFIISIPISTVIHLYLYTDFNIKIDTRKLLKIFIGIITLIGGILGIVGLFSTNYLSFALYSISADNINVSTVCSESNNDFCAYVPNTSSNGTHAYVRGEIDNIKISSSNSKNISLHIETLDNETTGNMKITSYLYGTDKIINQNHIKNNSKSIELSSNEQKEISLRINQTVKLQNNTIYCLTGSRLKYIVSYPVKTDLGDTIQIKKTGKIGSSYIKKYSRSDSCVLSYQK